MKFSISRICMWLLLATFWSVAASAQEKPDLNLFESQIVANTAAIAVSTPWSNSSSDWSSENGWKRKWSSNYRSSTIFLLIRLDEPLIEAAVNQWATDLEQPDTVLAAAKGDLEKRFFRDGVTTYLFFAGPLTQSSRWWAYSMPEFQQSVRLRTFSGDYQQNQIFDSCPTDRIVDNSPSFICMIGFDTESLGADPYFYLEVYPQFEILHAQETHFVSAVSPTRHEFRVELSSVPMITMIRQGIDVDAVKSAHLDPHLQSISAVHGDATANFVLDVGVRVVSGLLLRGIRVR